MTETLRRRPVQHERLSQRTSLSSGRVWSSDLRPLVQAPARWFDVAAGRAVSLYQAGLVGVDAARALVGILADAVWVDAPMPFVSSTDSGGISAEFDTNTVHLSIDAEPGGHLCAYGAVRGESDWEGALQDLPDGVEKWAWRLGVTNQELV
jgi:hypothetical protein